jgi:hypothetical protein
VDHNGDLVCDETGVAVGHLAGSGTSAYLDIYRPYPGRTIVCTYGSIGYNCYPVPV